MSCIQSIENIMEASGMHFPLHWDTNRWATTQNDDPEQELLSVQRLGFWCARKLCQEIAGEPSLNNLPQVVWRPMAWDAIAMGFNFGFGTRETASPPPAGQATSTCV